jgi:hypothetical protein
MSADGWTLQSPAEVRAGLAQVYRESKVGRIDPATASTLGGLLASLLRAALPSVAERLAVKLQEKMEAARQKLLARKVEVPWWKPA